MSKLVPPKGSNWGHINYPDLDALVAEVRKTPAGPAQDELLAKLDTKLVDEAVFLWVAHDVWPTALSPWVKGFVYPQSWYVDFSPVRVE